MEINERFLTILTPKGEFLRAQKLNSYYQIGQEIDFFPVEQEERKKSFSISNLNTFKGKMVLTTVLAVMLAFISIIPFYQNNQVYAYMTIDINPSIELGVNKDYEVIELIPYNEDGKKIVSQLDDWKKKSVHDVASEIIHEIKNQGYMKDNHEVVIATVYAQETIDKNDARLNEEIDEIQAVIQGEDLDLTVVEGTREDREKAKEKGLTTGLYKESIVKKNKVESKKVEEPVTVPQTQEEKQTKTDLQTQEEKQTKANLQKQEEKPTKANPQKQEEITPKENTEKQNEKIEAKEDQNSHIPPGQLKQEEKTDKNVRKVGEDKKEQATPTKQEKVNKSTENNGSNYKEQKMNKNNSENNSNQDQEQDSVNKKSKTEEKGK